MIINQSGFTGKLSAEMSGFFSAGEQKINDFLKLSAYKRQISGLKKWYTLLRNEWYTLLRNGWYTMTGMGGTL
jgi:hypothetical protein